jgi:Tol biopolymer transport system component
MRKSALAEGLVLYSVILCALLTGGLLLMPPLIAGLRSTGGCQQLAFTSSHTGNAEIYLLDIPSKVTLNLTHSEAHEDMLFWSPDGRQLLYRAQDRASGAFEVVVRTINTRDVQRYALYLAPPSPPQSPPSLPRFSDDGKGIIVSIRQMPGQLVDLAPVTALVFGSAGAQAAGDTTSSPSDVNQPAPLLYMSIQGRMTELYLINAAGKQLIARHPGTMYAPSLSADARCVAYVTGEVVQRSITILDRTSDHAPMLVSAPGATNPVWRPMAEGG